MLDSASHDDDSCVSPSCCWPRRGGDLGAAVAEIGAGSARFDVGHADAERRDFLGDGLGEAFDAPSGGVVGGVAGEGDLAAVGGDLDDLAVALGRAGVLPGFDDRLIMWRVPSACHSGPQGQLRLAGT